MKNTRFSAAILLGSFATLIVSSTARASNISYTGTVEGVWEDGFLLKTGDRTLTVDSWDICGDFTQRHISVGDWIAITGEFDSGEFDAFSITDRNGNSICH
jgi:hypothetical protein